MNIKINTDYMLGEALLIAGRTEPMIREFLENEAYDHLIDNVEFALDNADDDDHEKRILATFRTQLQRASLAVFEDGNKRTILPNSTASNGNKHAGMVYQGGSYSIVIALTRAPKKSSKDTDGNTEASVEAVSFEASKDSDELKAAIKALRELSPENQQKVIMLITTLEKGEQQVERAVA